MKLKAKDIQVNIRILQDSFFFGSVGGNLTKLQPIDIDKNGYLRNLFYLILILLTSSVMFSAFNITSMLLLELSSNIDTATSTGTYVAPYLYLS